MTDPVVQDDDELADGVPGDALPSSGEDEGDAADEAAGSDPLPA